VQDAALPAAGAVYWAATLSRLGEKSEGKTCLQGIAGNGELLEPRSHMKSRTLTSITAIALFAALAMPIGLAAQESHVHWPPQWGNPSTTTASYLT